MDPLDHHRSRALRLPDMANGTMKNRYPVAQASEPAVSPTSSRPGARTRREWPIHRAAQRRVRGRMGTMNPLNGFSVILSLSAFLFLALATATFSSDWPQFLGPARDGTYPGTNLAAQWPKEGPPIAWKKKVGEGFS